MDVERIKLIAVETHPIQYKVPLFRLLAGVPALDVKVLYAMVPNAAEQGVGFGVSFEWDVPLLEGYRYEVLENRASQPSVTSFSGCDTPGIYLWLKRERPDAVLVNGWVSKTCLQALWACRRLGIPCMVRGEANLFRPRAWWKHVLHRLLLRQYAAYLPIGSANRTFYRAHKCPESQLFLASYCVDNERFSDAATQRNDQCTALRASFGVPSDAVVFLFCGKLEAKKRPLDVLKALRQLSSSCPPCVIIAGDGPLRAELEQYARTHGLPVIFSGFLNQSRLPDAYAVSDVLVLPSDAGETWGLVVNEAMASGLPAVVSQSVGCGEDLIVEGQTGYTYPCGDVASLAGILKRLCNDRSHIENMGIEAGRHVNTFSMAHACEGIVQAVKAVCG